MIGMIMITNLRRTSIRIVMCIAFLVVPVLSATAYDFEGTVMRVVNTNELVVGVTQPGTTALAGEVELLLRQPISDPSYLQGKVLQFSIAGRDNMGRLVCDAYINGIPIALYRRPYASYPGQSPYYDPYTYGELSSYNPYYYNLPYWDRQADQDDHKSHDDKHSDDDKGAHDDEGSHEDKDAHDDKGSHEDRDAHDDKGSRDDKGSHEDNSHNDRGDHKDHRDDKKDDKGSFDENGGSPSIPS